MFITESDIAKELRVHRQRVYEWLNLKPEHGCIPHYQFGKVKRVDREQFEELLKQKLVK